MSRASASAPALMDPLSVYGALLPKAKVASVPRARVRLVDTVLFSGGRVWKWLYSAPASREVSEKVHTAVENIHEAFLQSGELGEGGGRAGAGECVGEWARERLQGRSPHAAPTPIPPLQRSAWAAMCGA